MAGVDAAGRRRIEKAVLREAFEGYLPESILWRQKEQFSDGVGYGWIDGLKAHAAGAGQRPRVRRGGQPVPGQPAADQGGVLLPPACSKQFFPGEACAQTVPGGKSIACSSPAAIAWDAAFADAADPSGRAVAGVHQAALA